jgi:hypothetical protein
MDLGRNNHDLGTRIQYKVRGLPIKIYVLPDGEEGAGSSLRLGLGSFYTMKFYQQFFDVDDRDVAIRLLYSMFPVPGK